VKHGIRTAALAGGMLVAVFTSGCGGSSGGSVHATVQSCTAYGLHAIEHHVTVTRKPPPCQGLSKAEVNQSVATAVVRAIGTAPKAVRRRRAAKVAPYLEHLVSALPPVAGSSPTATRSPAASSGRDLPLGIAALIAWLAAAGSGAYVLGSWIAHGGTLRRRARGTGSGSPPAMLFGHFGLALSGLVIWVAYLTTGWSALAWAAVVVLLPVAGLGMATLTVGLPGQRAATTQEHANQPGFAGGDTGVGAASASGVRPARFGISAGIQTATIDTSSRGAGGTGVVSVEARLSPLVVAAHGALAVTTIILVLLAALGGAAN
jgi:manganese efflux pump family protein